LAGGVPVEAVKLTVTAPDVVVDETAVKPVGVAIWLVSACGADGADGADTRKPVEALAVSST
jgi:ribosomal protein L37AE/L43A